MILSSPGSQQWKIIRRGRVSCACRRTRWASCRNGKRSVLMAFLRSTGHREPFLSIRGTQEHHMAQSLARALRDAHTAGKLAYLDGTINGEASPAFLTMFGSHLQRIGNELLGIPVKLRRAPADYHSTEQSETDGPPSLLSLRLLARRHERRMIGHYDDTILCAQAVSTWQAMLEQDRSCFLLV